MNWRRKELSHYSMDINWILVSEAGGKYEEALNYTSKHHYGLNPDLIAEIERFDIAENKSQVSDWLANKLGNMEQALFLVYGKTEVCRVKTSFFIGHWQDMMLPSRDDVVIIPERGDWVLFYCHEDEFEYGKRDRGV